MSIYVGNLSFNATEEDLQELFSQYGEIKRIQMPVDRETGRFRGFAFVEMQEDSQETAAIEALDSQEFLKRPLKVNKARPKEPRQSRPF
jgi:RNA recognition motif-containing protein